MSYLSIRNIKKSFNKIEVLKGIHLEIEKGEFICFLGPSGCGKTTLLRIIAGLEINDSGEIFLENKNITRLEPSKRNLSMVFQSYALFPNMTAYENIEYGLKKKIKNKVERKEKIENVLELVGLLEISEKYPDEMSGGQQQRVSLARAIAFEPDILLLDEPLSALDAKVRENLRNEIREIQKQLGITTIMVTHDQEEALIMGDKIAVINGGEVVQYDIPKQIYNNPKDIFVADFIGKINFISNLKDEFFMIRPENINYSFLPKNNYLEGKIFKIEFRGPIYRLFIKLNNDKIILDVMTKELDKYDLEESDKIFLKLI